MIDAAMAVTLSVLAYWVIGFGPALALLRGPMRWACAAAVAGPVGVVLTSLVGTILVSLDYPVSVWARPWLILRGLATLAATAWVESRPHSPSPFSSIEKEKGTFYFLIKSRMSPFQSSINGRALASPTAPADTRWFLALLTITTLIALVLGLAPAFLGGTPFTALRFNRWDALNYQAMARYLQTNPLSWIIHANSQTLAQRDAIFPHTANLLQTRYTTAILMAWVARLAGVPIARIEYTQGLIYLVLAIGPLLILGRLARLPNWINSLLGLAVSVGFWGVVVLDMRADSQLNSIPILLLIAVAAAELAEPNPGPHGRRLRLSIFKPAASQAEPNPGTHGRRLRLSIFKPTANQAEPNPGTTSRFSRWPQALLLALALAALLPVYPEILPMTIAALALFAVLRAWQTRDLWSLWPWLAGSVIFGLALGCFCWPHFFVYLRSQLGAAMQIQVNWELAYFPWLYNTPWRDLFVGPWGLSYFVSQSLPGVHHIGPWDVPVILAAAALTAIYAWMLLRLLWATSITPAVTITQSMGIMALAQFVFLLARREPWAAGKGMSFGYMFILAGLVFAWPVLWSPAVDRGRALRWAGRACAVLIAVWLVVQGLIAPIYRIELTHQGQEPPNYLWTGALYMRSHDYDTRAFHRALATQPNASLALALDNIWLTEYFALDLGENRPTVDWFGIRNRDEDELQRSVVDRQPLTPPAEFLLVARQSPIRKRLPDAEVAAENANFVLLHRTGPRWGTGLSIVGISQPTHIDPWGKSSLMLGNGQLSFNFLNLDDQPRTVIFEAQLVPGQALDPASTVPIMINAGNGPDIAKVSSLTEWKLRVPMLCPPGMQTLVLSYLSPAPGNELWIADIRLLPVPPVTTRP